MYKIFLRKRKEFSYHDRWEGVVRDRFDERKFLEKEKKKKEEGKGRTRKAIIHSPRLNEYIAITLIFIIIVM